MSWKSGSGLKMPHNGHEPLATGIHCALISVTVCGSGISKIGVIIQSKNCRCHIRHRHPGLQGYHGHLEYIGR